MVVEVLFENVPFMICVQFIPDYRLRPIIRTFLKPFIGACPSVFYEPDILPVLASVCPYSKCFLLLTSKFYSRRNIYQRLIFNSVWKTQYKVAVFIGASRSRKN